MFVSWKAGFVEITTPTKTLTLMADRKEPRQSLRTQANEMRERAARLLEHAALMDDAADRLTM